MAEPSQFTISHKEVLILLIKHLDIHDGSWMLNFSFGFGPSNFGASPDEMNPGIALVIGGVNITRIDPSLLSADPLQRPPPSLTVDAALINPRQKRTGSTRGGDKS